MNKVRPMTIEDAYKVAKIHTESWQVAYKGIIDQSILDSLDIDQKEKAWTEGIKDDPSLIRLVAEMDGDIKGFAVGLHNRSHPSPNSEGELWAIYIDPNFTFKGLGTTLFVAFQKELLSLGINSMCVWVLEENKNARLFYE